MKRTVFLINIDNFMLHVTYHIISNQIKYLFFLRNSLLCILPVNQKASKINDDMFFSYRVSNSALFISFDKNFPNFCENVIPCFLMVRINLRGDKRHFVDQLLPQPLTNHINRVE